MGTLTDTDFMYLYKELDSLLQFIAADNEYESFICSGCLAVADSLLNIAAVMLGHHAANELEARYEKRRKGNV